MTQSSCQISLRLSETLSSILIPDCMNLIITSRTGILCTRCQRRCDFVEDTAGVKPRLGLDRPYPMTGVCVTDASGLCTNTGRTRCLPVHYFIICENCARSLRLTSTIITLVLARVFILVSDSSLDHFLKTYPIHTMVNPSRMASDQNVTIPTLA